MIRSQPLLATPSGIKAFASDPLEKIFKASCADLFRASTSLSRLPQGVDAHGTRPWAEGPRAKPGQDEIGMPISVLGRRKIFPGLPCAFAGMTNEALCAAYSAAKQHPERNHQRQNDQHDREAALRAAPSLPVGNPVLHCIVPRPLSSLRHELFVTDELGKNSAEVWLCDDEESVMLP